MSDGQHTSDQQAAQVCLVPLHRHGSQPGRVLSDVLTIFGSGDGADIILASSKVDSTHAVVVCLGPSAYIGDLGAPGGTTVNGRRLRWARLAQGDEIGLGPFRFRVELTEGPGPFGEEEPDFSLRNDQTIGVVASIDPLLLVGSDPGCDVVLRHEAICPRHALIAWTAEGPVVRDLQRRERTRLNGRRMNFGRLVHGDSIGVGPYELVFEANGLPAARGSKPVEEPVAEEPVSIDSQLAALTAGRMDHSLYSDLGEISPAVPCEYAESTEPTPATTNEPEIAAAIVNEVVEAAPVEEVLIAAAVEESQPVVPEQSPPAEPVMDRPTPESQGQGGCLMTSQGNQTPQVLEERSRKLEQRYADLRTRVAAAQRALDERARKLRDGLNREREHLKTCRSELQKQADSLLKFAKKTRLSESDDSNVLDLCLAVSEDPPEKSSGRRIANGDAPAVANSDRSSPKEESGGDEAAQFSLQERARDLAAMVQIGRAEIDRTERKLEALSLDIRRLRGLVSRTRDRYQARDAELETRFTALERDQQSLREEREKLLAQIRRLNSKELEIQTQMKEAETCRHELSREAERLSKSQNKLEERQRAMRVSVEEERLRLRTRQAELRRKAAEVAQATRDRRRLVEEAMVDQEAALEKREAEIKARRTAIEEASKEELQKTTLELEEILSIGLGRLDAELEARQAELGDRARKLFEGSTEFAEDGEVADNAEPGNARRESARDSETNSRRGAEVSNRVAERGTAHDGDGDWDSAPADDLEGRRLEMLVHEVEALRTTLARMDERSENQAAGESAGQSAESRDPLSNYPGRTFSESKVSQLREQSAALRGAPPPAELDDLFNPPSDDHRTTEKSRSGQVASA